MNRRSQSRTAQDQRQAVWGTVLSSLILLAGPTGPASAQSSSCPPELEPLFRAMIGKWQVVDSDNRPLGSSSFEPAGACGVREHWSAGGSTGATLLAWEPSSGTLRMLGHDSTGSTVTYQGRVEQDVLILEGTHASADGRAQAARAEYEVAEDGWLNHRLLLGPSPQQLRESFRGRYATVDQLTRSDPPPARATPAPRAASESTRITATSPERAQPTPPAEPVRVQPVSSATERRTQQVEMRSPMVLRLPLGPVEKLPEGYAWSNRDTAEYTVDGVTVSVLRVTRSDRRGKTRLGVAFDLVGRSFSQRVDLGVRLIEDEQVIATGELTGQKVGRSLTEQADKGFVRKTVELELSAEEFERLTAREDVRPDLELTVATQR